MADNFTAGTIPFKSKDLGAGLQLPAMGLTDLAGADALGLVTASPAATTLLGRLKAIADGVTLIAGYTDGLEGFAAALNGYVDGLEALLATTNSSLSGIAGYVDGLEALATTLNGYVDGLETLQGTTNTTLTALAGYVDGLEALGAAATPAGENQIGKVGGNTAVVSAIPTTTAVAYAAGQVIGDKLTFANMARLAGLTGVLNQVLVHCKTAQTFAFDLVLFHTDPAASTFTNAAALALNAADFDKVAAIVSFTATNWTALGTISQAQANELARAYKVAGGATSLFGVIVSRGTPTLASASDLKVVLKALLD